NFLMGTFSVVLSPLGTQKMSFLWGEKTALEWAAWLIVYSVLLDKLDGFFAKRLKASTAFGAEFDSLADLVAFGLAPAMLFFHGMRAIAPQWAEQNVPIQILALSFYVLCAAWRLARYNVAQTGLKEYFVGMPSTLSGGFAALIFLIAYKWTDGVFSGTLASALVAAQIVQAGLMISGFYISKLISRRSKAFNMVQIVCVVIGYIFGLAMKFPEFLFSLIAIYSGVGFTYGIIRRSSIKATLSSHPED
ncbi:MAG TPA: CDP-alcohol phosphatidyltransferase family protein, partial [Fibrobacteria bacterium]|nr:CDP-alcohol phosphatidyltransferase family protein [Fibrobacteria bacterium]